MALLNVQKKKIIKYPEVMNSYRHRLMTAGIKKDGPREECFFNKRFVDAQLIFLQEKPL